MTKMLVGLVALGAVAALPASASADHRFGTDRGSRYSGHGGHSTSWGGGYYGHSGSNSSFGFSLGFGSGGSCYNFGYAQNYYRPYAPAYCPPPVVYSAPVYCPPPVVYAPAPVVVSPPTIYYSNPVYYSTPRYYYGGSVYYRR